MPIRVRLNAFDKDSSGSHSLIIETTSLDDFKTQEKSFEAAVPFSRFYFEHEVLEEEGDDVALIEIIEDYIN